MLYRIGLIALLSVEITIAGQTIGEQVAKLKHGRKISVELKHGFYMTEPPGRIEIRYLRGCLGPVGPDYFVLMDRCAASDGTNGPRIRFDEVQSIKPAKSHWPWGTLG